MIHTRSLLLSIALAAFGLIGVALYLQHGLDMLPCPLCVIQRYLFIAIVWVNHHHVLRFADLATSRLIWVNFAHLFTVSLLPFTTSWVAKTHFGGVAVCAYGVRPGERHLHRPLQRGR